ncbi:MAG TPA: phosphohydrolase [Cryomorphaceae bacterium]|nr:phosphohydrolase [Cryomorphaceae bacterium]
MSTKNKIINDPIYGFITVKDPLIYELIDHPYFQRLRRISQLGLTYLVYPGAYHTRFHHAIGAMHLMGRAIYTLRQKGHEITPEEECGVLIGILLHDVGHGPFSHALEHTIIPGVSHEALSLKIMEELNHEFDGALTLAIDIFTNNYPKAFLHHLISSQLDMDRLDYLRRDSFYSGVTEGSVNSERLITMLNVKDDQLVVDSKGIYSIEKFLVARRLMYWQVYMHKTVLSAEFMLVNILKRAKYLATQGEELTGTQALKHFLHADYTWNDFEENSAILNKFVELDDFDVMSGIKDWANHSDLILSDLSSRIINRNLLKIRIQEAPFETELAEKMAEGIRNQYGFTYGEEHYMLIVDKVKNHAYNNKKGHINLLYKDGHTSDISTAADQMTINALSEPVERHFICFPRELRHLL